MGETRIKPPTFWLEDDLLCLLSRAASQLSSACTLNETRVHTVRNQSSNQAVITEKCQVFRPAADSSAQPAAVEARPTQSKRYGVGLNMDWVDLFNAGGQYAILKSFERSLLGWAAGWVGGLRHFGRHKKTPAYIMVKDVQLCSFTVEPPRYWAQFKKKLILT
ncbi:unnamed protein product [Pleuronectes platessa]|uniref:Uncharacterized protein n=1 Tax=Pleuronectes platessa TaxID=8262 RepID=A0A9N7TY70_PLEPL|nr:unnamed protein product [Pleuronectes platessa]